MSAPPVGQYYTGANSYPQLQSEGPALTRAQVLHELKEAKSAGLLTIGESEQYPQAL